MEPLKHSIEYKVQRTINYFVLTKDIAIVKINEQINDTNKYKIIFYHPDYVEKLIDVNMESAFKTEYKFLKVAKSEFKNAYKTAVYGTNEFYELDKYFITPEDLFNYCLTQDTLNLSDFEFVYEDSYLGMYYPFDFNRGHIKNYIHPIRFNDNCYMLTNKKYDLEKIAKIIKPGIETKQIIILNDKYYDDIIIKDIPYYNQSKNYTKYINLYIVDDLDKNCPNLTTYKKLFKQCKIVKK